MILFITLWLLIGCAVTVPEVKYINRVENRFNRFGCYFIFICGGPIMLIAGLFTQVLEGLMPDDWNGGDDDIIR